jgi:hypothetical protein
MLLIAALNHNFSIIQVSSHFNLESLHGVTCRINFCLLLGVQILVFLLNMSRLGCEITVESLCS